MDNLELDIFKTIVMDDPAPMKNLCPKGLARMWRSFAIRVVVNSPLICSILGSMSRCRSELASYHPMGQDMSLYRKRFQLSAFLL